MPESMEERIQREKKERYEASDEYKEKMARAKKEQENIALARSSSISDADMVAEKAHGQGHAETNAQKWIESVTGMTMGDEPFAEWLKSGVVLCTLINTIKPGSIRKIAKSKMPFPQRENVKAFCDNVRLLGVPDCENFETGDLFEANNMKQVIISINSLGRHAANVEGYDGPSMSHGGGAKAGSLRGRGKTADMSAGMATMIGVDKPPPEVGSQEWINLQKAEEEAASKDFTKVKLKYKIAGKASGEIDVAELRKLLEAGTVDSQTLVLTDGLDCFTKLNMVGKLSFGLKDADFAASKSSGMNMIARAAGTLKTGWLTKKEGLRANWKPFWFELSPTGLAYYKSDSASEKRVGIVSLSSVTAAHASSAPGATPEEFEVVSKERTYRLRAAEKGGDNAALCKEWVGVISSALTK